MSSQLRAIIANSAARAYGTLLSLVTLFVSARYLGVEGRGTFVAATAWVALFATFFHLSLGQAMQYRLQSAAGRLGLPEQLGSLGGLGLILSALATITAMALHWLSDGQIFRGIEPLLLVIAFAGLPLLVWDQLSANILSAAARLDIQNRSQYLGRTLGLAMFFLLVAGFGWGVFGALMSQLVGQLAIALLVTVPLWKLSESRIRWPRQEVPPLLTAGLKTHLTTVSAYLLDQTSILMINNYMQKADVGFYQLAQQMITLMLILPQSALLVIYGGLARSNPDDFWPRQRSLILRVLALMAGGVVLAYLLAPQVIALVAGEPFRPSVEIFRYLLPSLLGMCLAILMTPQWIGRGLFFFNNAFTVVTAAAVIFANFLAIPRWGLDGAIAVRLAIYAALVPAVQLVFWGWCNRQSARAAATKGGLS